MITQAQYREGLEFTLDMLSKANIAISSNEIKEIEVTDFGLGNYPLEGAQIVTLLNTHKVGFKIICLMEGQYLPEHMHTASLGEEGKEETLRAIYGTARVFIPAEVILQIPRLPVGKELFYTSRHEVALNPPEQLTILPDTPHWILGGCGGCVVYSVSSWARCALDPFTDPTVVRETVVKNTPGTNRG